MTSHEENLQTKTALNNSKDRCEQMYMPDASLVQVCEPATKQRVDTACIIYSYCFVEGIAAQAASLWVTVWLVFQCLLCCLNKRKSELLWYLANYLASVFRPLEGVKKCWKKVPTYARQRNFLVWWLAVKLLMFFWWFVHLLHSCLAVLRSEAVLTQGLETSDWWSLLFWLSFQIDCSKILSWFH